MALHVVFTLSLWQHASPKSHAAVISPTVEHHSSKRSKEGVSFKVLLSISVRHPMNRNLSPLPHDLAFHSLLAALPPIAVVAATVATEPLHGSLW
jgi:hypothetical protein